MDEGEGEGMTGENFCLSLATLLGKETDRTKLNDAAEEISPPTYRPTVITTIHNVLVSSQVDSYEKGLVIAMTYHAMGRGGEAKLLSWTTTELDQYMFFLQCRWYEERTIRGYPMSFFSDVVAELDIFFLMSGYFMIGIGLFRS